MNPQDPRDSEHSSSAALDETQIEAIVAEAIATEAALARSEAAPPSSAIVWWRAQMRARQEAAAAADRPISIVHGLAIACGVGLALSLIGTTLAGVRGSAGWLTEVYTSLSAAVASVDLTSRWVMLPMTAMLASIVIASIAAYIIFADE
ncbi:MAG TPA: hypothetical protein VNC21_03810 [Vicinamibacterales bacterium]|nr:hypothetical protein [Vicinamibacterales bacterium]